MSITISIILVLTAVGLVFGFVLAYSNQKFAVKIDPKVHEVEEVLPKGQCGACGYAGCAAYAEAVVTNPDVPPNLCVPGKDEVAKLVAEITGKKAEAVEPRVARLMCAGSADKAVQAYTYYGVEDCNAANALFGGQKACKYGCLGFGNCARACPFGAIKMGPNGLPVVNEEKCTGCGKCVSVCPKGALALVPLTAHVTVNCVSRDKGPQVRKACSVGCLGCGLCARECPVQAIVVENNLAKVDHTKCIGCGKCVAKCPTKAIQPVKPEVPAEAKASAVASA